MSSTDGRIKDEEDVNERHEKSHACKCEMDDDATPLVDERHEFLLLE